VRSPDSALVASRDGRANAEHAGADTGRILTELEAVFVARVDARLTSHFRHEHKHDTDGTDAERAFRLREDHDRCATMPQLATSHAGSTTSSTIDNGPAHHGSGVAGLRRRRRPEG
jgi:hypothetical protein